MSGGRDQDVVAVEVLGPTHRETTADLLAHQIITAIALGEFQPHQRLPAERDLAESLGVSRSTVREAIARVVDAGLVEVRRGRSGGSFVCDSWGEATADSVERAVGERWVELEQLMDLRHLVEATVARTAAERRDSADSRAVREALESYQQAPDLRAAQIADLRLHRAVTAATHNPKLLELRESLLAQASLGFSLEPFTTSIYDKALPEHIELAQAVVEGDPDRAWAIGRRHFAITTDEVRATLKRATRHRRASS
ncbi:FadR/GntR family transcriptional regulator [Allobranchiibius sp. CTAmp26]|uniref:FadR/GntR family transcriptional regulator n=1 Tax=Allobranchiibius sp. CTAmp26 TaxID=2815214 RepID=UPI001AA1B244|nr:FCD domain-containing protein [Allobranchiibius sp. CTAmp26]MBO1753547.1 FadR family transcriptional regulator [Allobranchiibius sp. CTAmp26]